MNLAIHWLHLMAAIVWVGSMLFMSAVLQPALRGSVAPEYRLELYQAVGRRYRPLMWACWAILAVTGSAKLALRGMPEGVFGGVLGAKLALVSFMVALSLCHTYLWGPKLVRLGPDHPDYRGLASRMAFWGRINLLLLLGIVFCAAFLVVGE